MIGGQHEQIAADWNQALNRPLTGIRNSLPPGFVLDPRSLMRSVSYAPMDAGRGDGSHGAVMATPARPGMTLGQGR